jgi:uncharacterized protein YndB with AHSA1/START domain
MSEVMSENVPDVRKSVTVNIPLELAWSIFTERPIEWWPSSHVLVKSPRESITFEPQVGGRYFERAVDGTECQWGAILEWSPPKRLAMTWRIDGHWQMLDNDEKASEIEVSFAEIAPDVTEIELAHVKLWRHGEGAPAIHKALDGPSPGQTLGNFAQAVEAHLARERIASLSKAELRAEVQSFYAKQVRLLDSLQIEEYARTFTPNGVVEHAHRGERAVGRDELIAGMRAALPRYQDVVVRHFFDHLDIAPAPDGSINVSYYALVTRTGTTGKVVLEPTFMVEDVLVWGDGVLQTRSRSIQSDAPKV